eukprot:3777318-Rhodomonas_salina.4
METHLGTLRTEILWPGFRTASPSPQTPLTSLSPTHSPRLSGLQAYPRRDPAAPRCTPTSISRDSIPRIPSPLASSAS